jgi:hypothetical protein
MIDHVIYHVKFAAALVKHFVQRSALGVLTVAAVITRAAAEGGLLGRRSVRTRACRVACGTSRRAGQPESPGSDGAYLAYRDLQISNTELKTCNYRLMC